MLKPCMRSVARRRRCCHTVPAIAAPIASTAAISSSVEI
jgi:hypothetical protein